MKMNFVTKLAVALLAMWIVHTVRGQIVSILPTVDASDFQWSVTNNEVTITGYIGSNTVISIPPAIDGYPVKVIGESAFAANRSITDVTISEGVTSIEYGAFQRCSNLSNVSIPDSMKHIADYAFQSCGLSHLTIPDSVESIGGYSFSQCELLHVQIGSGTVKIGSSAYYFNRGLMSFDVDSGNPRFSSENGLLLESDGRRLVCGVNGDVVIPDGVVSIAPRAFYNLTNLTSVVIPASVTSISSGFEKCSKLKRIVFLGDAPEVKTFTPAGDCTAYVKRDSTGWGVEIPGTWQGINIAYLEDEEPDGGGVTNDVVATSCEVTAVSVKPRWPWNGIVDIHFTLEVEPEGAKANVSVIGRDTVKNETILPRHSNAIVELPSELPSGTHRFIWDIGTEYPQFHSEAFTVDVTATPVTNQVQESGLYMVIDLSDGTNAVTYPVSYLNEVPEGGWTTEHKTTKLVMRRIEPGTFMMGDNDRDNVVQVTHTKPFYMGVFEVTQKQYELVTGNNPSKHKGDARPVETVSWNVIRGDSDIYNWPSNRTVDAASFMGIIQQKTGLCLDLPTEAQWEYACRAGTTSAYNNGGSTTNDLNVLGRYSGNEKDGKGGYLEHTTVGSYRPNAWGLYDMHGNVVELCLNWFGGGYGGGIDPVGPVLGMEIEGMGVTRISRGGSWGLDAEYCSSWLCILGPPSYCYINSGFRLACSAGQ